MLTTRMTSNGRRIAGNVLLSLASCVFALVAAELLLRFQEPYLHLTGDRAEWSVGRYQGHSVWHHWSRPQRLTGVVSISPGTNPEPIIYRTNNIGCRDDRDFDSSGPAEGVYRIVVMGDSFTEGYYEDETFARILERRLNEAGPARHEVINCGTSSYSPVLHYLRYRDQLAELRPHEVIANIDLTDVFDDNVRYLTHLRLDENGDPVSAGPPRFSMSMVADEMRFRFYLGRLVLGNPRIPVKTFTMDDLFGFHDGRIPPESDEWQAAVANTLGMLDRLAAVVRRSGASLTLSMYPYREQLESVAGRPQWHREFEWAVQRFAAERGIGFYSAWDDLQPIFASGERLYWRNDIHFTYLGQRIWSEAFADHYVQRGRRPADGTP